MGATVKEILNVARLEEQTSNAGSVHRRSCKKKKAPRHRLILHDREAGPFARAMKQHGEAVIVRVMPDAAQKADDLRPGGDALHEFRKSASYGGRLAQTYVIHKYPIRPGACWAAETFHQGSNGAVMFKADYPDCDPFNEDTCGEDCSMVGEVWRSPVTMPYRLCRPEYRKLTADVRVCRASQITDDEALRGGVRVFKECETVYEGKTRDLLLVKLGIDDPRTWVAVARVKGEEG